jgi:anti-sigma factor RsiW
VVQYEFDQLLEDLWDGRLDEAGRRRLEDLCAADPRLAARYRQERNLTGLLKQCGPNHAPDDLVRAVMGRLETRVRIRPARPWYWWMMEPAFRTAFAAVVLVAFGVELGLLLANKNSSRQIASLERLPSTPVTVQSST